jgi:ABC-2 type transport system ATP-binding protein
MIQADEPMIHLERVTKLYGSVIGVNDVTVSLTPGAYGLVGPNGSGKSTLLNVLTGQLRATLGRVRVLGRRPWNNAELYRVIGVCPEHEALYANVSGLEWVCYLLELHGFGRHDATKRAEEALEQVGLADARHRHLGGYSRGMRQRTKLAQALAHDPELLVLDEPFGGVDPVGRHQMIEILQKRIQEGRGLIMASHLLHEVEAVTRSFLLICGGRLLASGTAEEVHSLLDELPKEMRLRCDNPNALARRLLDEEMVESVRFVDDELLISSRRPAAVFDRLPEIVESAGTRVLELHSTDSSLQALFDTLLKIHRGMAPSERSN